jgi:hypothetical protein
VRWLCVIGLCVYPIVPAWSAGFCPAQVPADTKVAIVSVVGAFRTGKSFLLDLLLRYLRWSDEHPDGEDR